MDAESQDAWLRLIRLSGLGGVGAGRLLRHFGSAADALRGSAAQWRQAGLAAELHAALTQVDPDRIAADRRWLDAASDRHLLPLDDPRFPQRLREAPGCPLALFVVGDPALLELPQLAIVGARTASPAGRRTAEDFAGELTRHGLVITSGLALGIDASAHRGALASNGLTVAVCATGLDRVYPSEHRDLAHQIGARGALVSELPPGVRPHAALFPRRNRLIAGLSLGVLVVEAALDSGSLITARLAVEAGREVFAVPGSIHNALSRGCHRLIREGAKLVESAADILEEIAPQLQAFVEAAQAARGQAEALPPLPDAPELATLLELMGWASVDIDALVERSGRSVAELSLQLLTLEMQGWVAAAPGGSFVRLPSPQRGQRA